MSRLIGSALPLRRARGCWWIGWWVCRREGEAEAEWGRASLFVTGDETTLAMEQRGVLAWSASGTPARTRRHPALPSRIGWCSVPTRPRASPSLGIAGDRERSDRRGAPGPPLRARPAPAGRGAG